MKQLLLFLEIETKLLMRILLVFLILLPLSARSGAGQPETHLSLDVQNKELKEVLSEIEDQTGLSFVYSEQDVDLAQKVTIKADNEITEVAFGKLFDSLQIDFMIRNNQVLLVPALEEEPPNRDINISGTIYCQTGNFPLPGVNVMLQGTGRGTVTNVSGEFSLEVPSEGAVLVFSFVGYKSKEVPVSDDEPMTIFLEEDMELLEGVVVVGYGRESRKLLSSSVSDVGAETLERLIVHDLGSALQGRAPGIQVTQNSGMPGAAVTTRVRGISSINAGAEPLYVIDGVPMVTQNLGRIGFGGQSINTLSDINPNDIESVSILKDASATAIYGARGSNGVILITTKRGQAYASRVAFSSSFGFQQPVRTLDLLNTRQFMEYRNEASMNDGGSPVYTQEQINTWPHDTDWQSEIYRTAPLHSYNLSFSGGDTNTQYFISGSYFGQEGIAIGTDYERINGRVSLDQQVNDRIKVGASLSLSRSYNNRIDGDQSLDGVVPNAIALPPIYPVYNEDGSYNDDGPYGNPVNIGHLHIDDAYNWRTLGNSYAQFRLLDGLTYEFKYGLDYVNFREHSYYPMTTRLGSRYNGLGLESASEVLQHQIINNISYLAEPFSDHYLDLLVGADFESYQRRNNYMRGQDFPDPQLQYIASAATIVFADASGRDAKLHSYYGRAKYNIDNKYIFTLSGRYDGSSRFGRNNKFGFFPSGDFAWRISEETFLSMPAWLSELKLRLSHGVTGNDQIPDFGFMALFSTGNDYETRPGITPSSLGNPDLKWETTHQTNVGIDAGLLAERIIVSADFYYKRTSDLLFSRPIPSSAGFSSVLSNVGEIENKGVELVLHTQNIDSQFSWLSSVNMTFNRNKVLSLYNDQPLDDIGRGSQRIEVGEPVGIFYGWEALGVDPTTGDIVFADINGDGIIDANDRVKIGSPHPLVHGGVTNDFHYRNISLQVLVNYSYGNDVFNGVRRYAEVMRGLDNQTTAILDRWQQPGDVTQIPRATNADPNANNRVSSRFVEDGSYLKIKSVRLGYSFNRRVSERIGLNNMQVYVVAQNLYTFTKYSGLDPELNYAGQDILRMGTDFYTYPHARSLSVGIQIEI